MQRATTTLSRAKLDSSPRARVLARVVEQIVDRAAQQRRVALDRGKTALHLHVERALGMHLRETLCGAGEHVAHLYAVGHDERGGADWVHRRLVLR